MELSHWIMQMKNQICPEEDQVLFNEATGCLSSGFYRSSYVIAWVAIVESLKKKIFESSNLGDAQAEVCYKKIEEAESKKNSVDKIILEQAIELRIIESHDESKLSFLWEQRCIFAHPYSKAPDETDVRHIISSLVDICLSKPLHYRKNYIDELSVNLVTKPFFLPENNDDVKNFARKIIARVPQNLHPYFFKTFLFKLGSIVDDDSKFKIQLKLRHFLVELFKCTPMDLGLSEWTLEQKVISFPYECIIGFVHWDIWNKLPERVKDLLLEYAIGDIAESRQANVRQIIGLLLTNIELEEKYKDKFLDKLNTLEFKRACNYYGNNGLLYERILKEFDTNIYTRQNSIIDFFREEQGSKLLEELDLERQITMGWHIVLSNIRGSYTAQHYLNDLSKTANIPFGIKIGLLYGSIITSKNYIYIKKDNFNKILKIIDKLKEDEIVKAFDYTINVIKADKEFNTVPKDQIDFMENEKDFKPTTIGKVNELKQELKKYCL